MDPLVKQEVAALLKKAEEGALVKSMEKVYEVLKVHQLMWCAHLHSKWIGVHESNRDGMMISPDHCHQLAQDLFEVGFVSSECHGICLELLDDNEGNTTKTFNMNMVASSRELLLCLNLVDFPCRSPISLAKNVQTCSPQPFL